MKNNKFGISESEFIKAYNDLKNYPTIQSLADYLNISSRTVLSWASQLKASNKKLANRNPNAPTPIKIPQIPYSREELLKALVNPTSIDYLSSVFSINLSKLRDEMSVLRKEGYNIQQFGDRYSLESTPAPGEIADDGRYVYKSRRDNTYVFGITSDNHLCSKYERLDVLHDLYDKFAEAGVDRVFNCGNWIDGEAHFNKYDLLCHGLGEQVDYFLKHYPQRPGLKTYYVAGDDHEGWYCQREGIDIGRLVENEGKSRGRDDLVYLGYMESYIEMQNYDSENTARLLVCHPGGGSSYAFSYTSQKSVEAYEGGEKPQIALYGHYHKLEYCLARNVHAIQVGCTQDQTPFMRKKKLSSHIGGVIVTATQDESGSITRCQVEFLTYFNRGYYNNQWSHSGKIIKGKIKGK